MAFKLEGWEVRTAPDGLTAAKVAREFRPDAAVLDLNLGGETSVSVADALAARGIPFLVATGYGAAGLPAHLKHIPVLPKPYDPADLTVAIDRLCTGAR